MYTLLVANLRGRRHHDPHNVIRDISGFIKPGEMMLVLGKPGSGTTTFLRAISNQPRKETTFEGLLHFGGISLDGQERIRPGDVIFNDEGMILNIAKLALT